MNSSMVSRRAFLKAAGVGALALAGCKSATGANAGLLQPGLSIGLTRAPYTNNGATPWYASVPIGTPGQTMRIALDTGSNFIWTTSTLCGSGCEHLGGGQFDYAASSTFAWVDQTQQTVNFGPWGEMVVETGNDLINLSGVNVQSNFYLAASYSGDQFEQLEWDGGIGMPSGTAYAQSGMPFLLGDLFNAGVLDPYLPYLSFGDGQCILGGFDLSNAVLDEYIYLPWVSYTPYPAVDYLWDCAVADISVGGTSVAQNQYFCLDTGSSRFKGDPDNIVDPILSLIAASGYTNSVELTFANGTMTVPPDVYMQTIEAGPDQGQTLPQFEPMAGLDNQLLVGSVLMDHLYTVFEYAITGTVGNYTLAPVGMWCFNIQGGEKIITAKQSAPPAFLTR